MTNDDAKDWIRDRYGEAGFDRCARIISLVLAENERQNLISKKSAADIWVRHIVDSAQLSLCAGVPSSGSWLDIGTGAGSPGLVIAALEDRLMQLVEPRKKRADFLAYAADLLGLTNVMILRTRAEQVRTKSDIISARAVAPLSELLTMTHQLGRSSTTWVFPKGRTVFSELEVAQSTWQGVFHVEQSLTSDEAFIVVVKGVASR